MPMNFFLLLFLLLFFFFIFLLLLFLFRTHGPDGPLRQVIPLIISCHMPLSLVSATASDS